ncbi:hypothetical protein GGR50DRAFT_194567 [Xylaria sp. CBS 124048]|nr:hypothetical protein GGR50DRAFT_194567 [Xylaria sp. CBS 124048]
MKKRVRVSLFLFLSFYLDVERTHSLCLYVCMYCMPYRSTLHTPPTSRTFSSVSRGGRRRRRGRVEKRKLGEEKRRGGGGCLSKEGYGSELK